MKKNIGEELLSLALSKLILVVALIVCLGAIMGIIGYSIFHAQQNIKEIGMQMPKDIIKDGLAGWRSGERAK